MADQEQLEILKKGPETWNEWRKDHSGVQVDLALADLGRADLSDVELTGANLSGANLSEANLVGANLREANLRGVNFRYADLIGAKLREANLRVAYLDHAHLSGVDLRGAYLFMADLSDTDLSDADLRGADLSVVNLRRADLSDADLTGADLSDADLNGANLAGAKLIQTNFKRSRMGYMLLGKNDLSAALGLETIFHDGPSTIGTDTIRISKGQLPVDFLRGCGLSDWEIEIVKLYGPQLSNQERNELLYKIYDLQVVQAIQISPLFISYSHADSAFVDELGKMLRNKGIRFWRDIHDATAGRLEKQIDRAIRHNPTVLLVLSKDSIKSDWVEHEVRTARSLEKEIGRDVLCPVALDNSWKISPWPKRVMEQVMEYNILDYSCWEDHDEFKRVFAKLVDGLNLYYRKDK